MVVAAAVVVVVVVEVVVVVVAAPLALFVVEDFGGEVLGLNVLPSKLLFISLPQSIIKLPIGDCVSIVTGLDGLDEPRLNAEVDVFNDVLFFVGVVGGT